jgi:alkanesulfonate monooxygenase SsuD/methylene tetrahydromethanopterin reductase-like flavin-dependent oxidoreductase (luciferase family)
VRQAIGLPTVGEFADVHALVDLAVRAEEHGWDGVHLWDHLLYHEPGWQVTSSLVAASAVAQATSRLNILLTVVLPRRQVQDVARDMATLDALSRGRLTLITIIGSMDSEYADFGLDPDMRQRGRELDARLERMTQLWSQWEVPDIPIWCGARWPRKVGLRRAARWDGAMVTFAGQREGNVPVAEFAQAAQFLRDQAPRAVELAVEGGTAPGDSLSSYVEAGMTWWIEAFGWWRGGPSQALQRTSAGPL